VEALVLRADRCRRLHLGSMTASTWALGLQDGWDLIGGWKPVDGRGVLLQLARIEHPAVPDPDASRVRPRLYR
jgi:hypothetical protein